MRSLKNSGGTKCMGSLSQFPTALRWTWETVGTRGWYRVCQGQSERQLPGGASFHHHKQSLSRLRINEWSLMESEGAPAVPPELCGESKLRNAKPCLWSCPFLGDTLLPLVPDLAFLGGKVPVPEKLHRCRMQKTSPRVSLVDDSEIVIMESGTHPSGGCVPSHRENSWAFISLKAKLERNVGVCGVTFLLNSWWHLCLKVGAHTSIPPCLKGEQDSKIESQRASYPGIIGNRHAMHCVVLTRRRLSASSRALWCIKYQGL